jgi:hypothetical protein
MSLDCTHQEEKALATNLLNCLLSDEKTNVSFYVMSNGTASEIEEAKNLVTQITIDSNVDISKNMMLAFNNAMYLQSVIVETDMCIKDTWEEFIVFIESLPIVNFVNISSIYPINDFNNIVDFIIKLLNNPKIMTLKIAYYFEYFPIVENWDIHFTNNGMEFYRVDNLNMC